MSRRASEEDRRAYPLLTERERLAAGERATGPGHEPSTSGASWHAIGRIVGPDAQQVNATEVRERNLGNWLDRKNEDADRRLRTGAGAQGLV